MREPSLTKTDEKRLAKCEDRIAGGMRGFVDAGLALAEINENHLFLHYVSFAEYCKQRWEITPNYAKRLMRAAAVVRAIGGEGSVPIGTLPATETQARPLTTLDMEEVNGVWQSVVESAPMTDGGAPRITAAFVREKVEAWKRRGKSSEPPGFDDESEPPEPARTPTQRRANRSAGGSSADYGKCPNCGSTKWDEDEEGVSCAKCHHPHGEPAGDVDEDNVKTQRQKTVKTVEALQRAFDDLNHLHPATEHGGATKWSAAEVDGTLTDMGVVTACKGLLRIARGWK